MREKCLTEIVSLSFLEKNKIFYIIIVDVNPVTYLKEPAHIMKQALFLERIFVWLRKRGMEIIFLVTRLGLR